MSEWTSVADDYPPVGEEVLVVAMPGEMYIAEWRGEEEGWVDYSGCDLEAITHWMPLPEAPHA